MTPLQEENEKFLQSDSKECMLYIQNKSDEIIKYLDNLEKLFKLKNVICNDDDYLKKEQLIASAPDLLQACKMSLREFENFRGCESFPVVAVLRKAISKAELKL